MLFAKFVTETNKQLLPCGSCKYEFENFRHTGPLQSDWSKSVLAPPLSIPKCLPFFHAKSMGLAILSLYYRCHEDRKLNSVNVKIRLSANLFPYAGNGKRDASVSQELRQGSG